MIAVGRSSSTPSFGWRLATAERSAEVASAAAIRSEMAWPTIRFEQTSLITQA